MRSPLLLLMICVSMLSSFTSRAQLHYFKHYQKGNGLSHNSVTAILQDSRGMLWVGTKAGLNRFDGYNFKYYADPTNSYDAIGDNNISSLCEDRSGMIWIGTGRGLFKYDPYLDRIEQFPELKISRFSNLLADAGNSIWFLADNQLYRYEQRGNKLTDLKKKALCLAQGKKNTLWLGHSNGSIERFEPVMGKSKFVQLIDPAFPESTKPISKILETDSHGLLIGTYKQGLKFYNLSSGMVSDIQLHQPGNTQTVIRDIIASGKDEYWIGSETGLYIYNSLSRNSRRLQKIPGDEYSLSDNAIYAVCKDRQNNIWIGTYFGGLNYFSAENARFKKYYPIYGQNSIAGSAIKELAGDGRDNIWIGTEDGGLSKLNLTSGSFHNYNAADAITLRLGTNIQGMLLDQDRLYVGSYMHGLQVLNARTWTIQASYPLIGTDAEKSDFITCIYRTKKGKILFGTLNKSLGILAYDPAKRIFTKIGKSLFNSSVQAIFEDHSGVIWAGTKDSGAYYFDPTSGREGFRLLRNNPVFQINGIYEDSSYALWLTTDGGGLVRLDQERKFSRVFTKKSGLPSNVTFRLLEDDHKNLWISTLNGLARLKLSSLKINVYTQENGLPTNQFNYNSALKMGERLYFGSIQGLVEFKPGQFEQHVSRPPTYFTGLQIDNQEVRPGRNSPLKKAIMYTDTLVLRHTQASFSLAFATLDYTAPTAIKYQYRMDGLDKHWNPLNGNRSVYFTDLAPGDYIFLVKSESSIGSWTGAERRLYVKILPPFWKTYLAYGIYLLCLSLFFVMLIGYYLRRLKRKNKDKHLIFEQQMQQEMYQAKIEFFTHITHEIQTPLTLIDGPVQVIGEKIDNWPEIKEDFLMIRKYTNRLLELTRQLLDFRKTEVNGFALNFVRTDVNEVIEELINNFKLQAAKSGIMLSFDSQDEKISAFVDKEAFVKICGNLISNGVKYAKNALRVELSLLKSEDPAFSVRFINDGSAIPVGYHHKIFNPFFRLPGEQKEGTGIGLSLAASLTSLHNGTLNLIESRVGRTVFELVLPLHQGIEFNLNEWKGGLE
ncbi:two-component regulator propeller domain-containing protein [Pedobacter sp. V48]|uniref:ligand-binding sensor domain-containing protein n=1 Tax=Pedobacter sp. V48 TaxID=509635 RepID=UPI0013782945|nr:sensor histidine kinase [Pedobacter sp. V48]